MHYAAILYGMYMLKAIETFVFNGDYQHLKNHVHYGHHYGALISCIIYHFQVSPQKKVRLPHVEHPKLLRQKPHIQIRGKHRFFYT